VLSWKAHQVDFHEVDRAADAAATFSQVTVAIGGFEFVGRAEEFEHGNQAAGGIANLDPAFDLFVQKNADRFRGRYRRCFGSWSSDGRFFQLPRFPRLDIRAVGGRRPTGADGDDFFLRSCDQVPRATFQAQKQAHAVSGRP